VKDGEARGEGHFDLLSNNGSAKSTIASFDPALRKH
jgi:hypothetical protein